MSRPSPHVDVFPVGATLDGGRFRITRHIAGERWAGRYLADADDGSTVLVTTGGTQTVPVASLTASLAMRAPSVAPLLHVGPLESDDPAAHHFHGLVEHLPPGRPLAELRPPLAPEVGLDLLRSLADGLLSCHRSGVVLGHLPAEVVYVAPHPSAGLLRVVRRGRPRAWVVTGVAPRAPVFWRTATKPDFALPQVFVDPFVAPEASWGHRPSPRADSFVLALYVVWLLTGLFPFAGVDFGSRLMQLQSGVRPRWTGGWMGPRSRRRALATDLDIPRELRLSVETALDHDPGVRPSVEALRHAILETAAEL